ncbi:hypothetical protein [Lactococcus phage PMBT68]|nr:hypothetical protein [Lactococcus phage P1411]
MIELLVMVLIVFFGILSIVGILLIIWLLNILSQ